MSNTDTNRMRRRSFITKMAVGSVGASLAAAVSARAQGGAKLTHGDVAILRFLLAAELIEADLWQQYAELANNNPAYGNALQQIDPDMVAYIQQNTNDEFSHQAFLTDFLISQNLEPVDLDAFRNLPSSQATRGATDRAIDQSDEPQRGYELVLEIPAAPVTPTSGLNSARW